MSKARAVVTGLVIIASIAAGYLVLRVNDQRPIPTITYEDTGFAPSVLTVRSGETVVVKNASASYMQFQSHPHPVHTDNTELNVGTVAPGESKTFTPTKTGTWGYHNHLDFSQMGTLVVE